jgi:antitoxin Phd
VNVYTFSEARQRLATVLEEAQRKGPVRIKRRDGSEFEAALVRSRKSPLDVEGVDLGLSAEEIVSAIRETHTRDSG